MQTSQSVRKRIISEIEASRSNPVIACVWSCRRPFYSQPADDFIRPFMDHLDSIAFEKRKKIDLVLIGSGGTPDWAHRVMSVTREYCDEVNAIVPFSASGAAALLAIGSDRLIMGRYASLSAVDGFGCGDQTTGGLQKDMQKREEADIEEIRLILRRMLTSRKERVIEAQLKAIESSIVGVLSRDEARAGCLPLSSIKSDLEDSIWNLYKAYEKHLGFRNVLHPSTVLGDGEEKVLDGLPLAIIESRNLLHVFRSDLLIRRLRSVPENPEIAINLRLVMPEKTPQTVEGAEAVAGTEAVLVRHLKPKLEKTIRELIRREWTHQTSRQEIVLEISKAAWETYQPPS